MEKTITEYEEQNERQRTLLQQLIHPKVRLSPSETDRSTLPEEAADAPSETPFIKGEIKGEQDIISTQLCSEPLPAPTWNTKRPQTPLGVVSVEEPEEGNSVCVKTEERQTWTPPGDTQLQHNTVPLPPPGGALLLHAQTEEEELPQARWIEESQDQPQTMNGPISSAAVTALFPAGGAFPLASKTQKPQKRFHCTICPKAFASNFHLVTHMRVHTGERPFECPVCEKSFRVKGNLDQHMMIHYDLRPFSCTFCGKAFSQKSNLNNHLWVHTGVKPFSCSVCGKQYRQRSSLSLHMASH